MNPPSKWIEWFGNALIVLSAVLTSQNIYPLNLWVATMGGIIWVWVAIAWRKTSLAALNVVLLLITVYGLIDPAVSPCK